MDNSQGEKQTPIAPAQTDALQEGHPPISTPAPTTDAEAPEQPASFFSTGNLIMLAIVAGVLALVIWKFNWMEMGWIVKAVLGLSFIIFIHELGHFLAAKWCNVNVKTFSIGFGPAIPGCAFTWGETRYKIGILPLGGYVEMLGQVDGDESSDGSEDDPRSYKNKSVAQRMLIISAGVIMNAILAVLCFIFVYQGPGKTQPSAAIYEVDSGKPVAIEGLRTGSLVVNIDGIQNPHFNDLRQVVIFSMKGQPIPLTYQLNGQEPVTIQIESQKDKHDTIRSIGVRNPPKLQLASKLTAEHGPFYAGTPAQQAKFEHDDIIVGMTDPKQAGPYDPAKVTALPDDWRYPGQGQADYFEFARRLQILADKDVVVRVKRGEDKKEVDITVKPHFRLRSPAVMEMGPVLMVRKDSPASKAGVQGPTIASEQKLEGDRILSVTVKEADGTEKVFKDKDLDPEQLPFQLKQWASRLVNSDEKIVTLQLRRHVELPGNQFKILTVNLKWDETWQFDRVLPLSVNAPMAIPELGLAYQIRTVVADVKDEESKLKVGDVIKNIKVEAEGHKEEIKTDWLKHDLEEGQWAFISNSLYGASYKTKKIFVKVERVVVGENNKGEKKIIDLEFPVKDSEWGQVDRGWHMPADTRLIIAANTLDAVRLGFIDTWSRMKEVYFTIRGLLTRDIDYSNVRGPLTIAYGAYRSASADLGDFIFFLGLISINLAVVNFLPIPILDGGHMVFLIYEKLRGKPASEGVRVWATYIGLAMIVCLMIFVLYQDVVGIFFS